ncbi:hypothetical protein PG994_002790 [Apiospora phragmitis]|uniref:Uncharacterized protein n=1 Tax=Apiospora phragmitis TaxID=2905665 RepID=A0ABR1W6A0_9PEZI
MVVNFLTRDERVRALGFECQCEGCHEGDPDNRYLSDLRRTLLRGLDAISNVGLSTGAEHIVSNESNPIIADEGDHRNVVELQEDMGVEVSSYNPFQASPVIEEVD